MINPSAKKLPYDPNKDIALVSMIASAPIVLLVHPSVPATDVPSMIKYISANKGKLAYRLLRHRLGVAPERRALEPDDPQRHESRGLQGRGADDPGLDWRPDSDGLRQRGSGQVHD